MIDAKEIADHAVKLYEAINNLDTWRKREVVIILNAIVELEVQRLVHLAQSEQKP